MNTAVGSQTLEENTTGSNNTALGHAAVENGTTGSFNTGIGAISLFQNNGNYKMILCVSILLML